MSRESGLDQQSSLDEQIAKFEKILKATEKRNARFKELVETEERYKFSFLKKNLSTFLFQLRRGLGKIQSIF